MTILDDIVGAKRREVAERRLALPLPRLTGSDLFTRSRVSLKDALTRSATGIIAEFKRRSPSKGWIFPDARVAAIVPQYEAQGATACSILTDESFFGGSRQDLLEARALVRLPLLRKDFIIDEYQLFEAKALGADVVLLIAAALTPVLVRQLAARARELDLEVLLELHHESELDCVDACVDVVGVNNRDLRTFTVALDTSLALGERIPRGMVKISESGIASPDTVRQLRQAGFQGFLMGENFMKTADPALALRQFIAAL